LPRATIASSPWACSWYSRDMNWKSYAMDE
jgi:hypothetical protein